MRPSKGFKEQGNNRIREFIPCRQTREQFLVLFYLFYQFLKEGAGAGNKGSYRKKTFSISRIKGSKSIFFR